MGNGEWLVFGALLREVEHYLAFSIPQSQGTVMDRSPRPIPFSHSQNAKIGADLIEGRSIRG